MASKVNYNNSNNKKRLPPLGRVVQPANASARKFPTSTSTKLPAPTPPGLATPVDKDMVVVQTEPSFNREVSTINNNYENARKIGELRGHDECVLSLCMGGGGSRREVYSASMDRTIRAWSLDTLKCLRVLTGHESWVSALAVNETGDLLISGSRDRSIRIWNAASGQCLRTLSGAHEHLVSALLVKDGNELISGAWDSSIKIWDLSAGQVVRAITGNTFPINSLVILPSGLLAAASNDICIKIFNMDTCELANTLSGHSDWVKTLCLNGQGELISASNDKTIRVWNATTGECLKAIAGQQSDDVCSMTLVSEVSGHVIAGTAEAGAKIWNVELAKCVRVLPEIFGCRASVMSGRNELVIESNGDLELWSL